MTDVAVERRPVSVAVPLGTPADEPAPVTRPTLRRGGGWRGKLWEAAAGARWLQGVLLLAIAAVLFSDRYLLCREFLFRYTDEDQAVMWYAAADLLRGRIAEPCFYGQDYNTCVEGFLAAPLAAAGVPYHVACPLVTVLVGLVPFLAMAWVAWRRGHALTAGAALLVPLLLPVRYGMMAGMPRGFHPGIAVAMIPALLLLPPRPRPRRAAGWGGVEEPLPAAGGPRWLGRTWAGPRYFAAAAFAVAAVEVGENSGIVLAAAAVYALLTSWREWKFWLFGAAGLVATLPYPLLVNRFYGQEHPDYPIYLRGQRFEWSWGHFQHYWNQVLVRPDGGMVLPDLVPVGIRNADAPAFAVAAFAALGAWLLMRRRVAGLAAGFAAVFVLFVSFGYSRVYVTTTSANSASFPYARIYLALPVVFVYLLLLANLSPWQRWTGTAAGRWVARGGLAGLLVAAVVGFSMKRDVLAREISREVNAQGGVVCPQIPVAQVYAVAHEIQHVAREHKADVLIVGGGDRWKHLAYALFPTAGIDAIYGPWERRAWRMTEEFEAKHDAILFVHHGTPPSAKPAGTAKTLHVDFWGSVHQGLPVIPRSHRFKGEEPLKLGGLPVGETLRLTSLDKKREFAEGGDYLLTRTAEGVEVRRAAGGGIGEAEAVQVGWRGLTAVQVPEIFVAKTDGKNAYQAGVPALAGVHKQPPREGETGPRLRVAGNGR